MTIIYALSGIALNHKLDWNPNYEITHQQVQWQDMPAGNLSKEQVLTYLERHGEEDAYKKHYYPVPGRMKIFIDGGSFDFDRASGEGILETIRRRPVFFEVNFLHYNPGRLWTWFSDVFCVALILLAITGLFVLKGKNGITGRGWWLTTIGVVIPLLFLLLYL
jgi:hypothetical protein